MSSYKAKWYFNRTTYYTYFTYSRTNVSYKSMEHLTRETVGAHNNRWRPRLNRGVYAVLISIFNGLGNATESHLDG